MRNVAAMLFCLAAGLSANGSAAPKKQAGWPLMNKVEAECASATAAAPQRPTYRTTYEERNLKLFVVNEEPVKFAPPSSHESRTISFGDQCSVHPDTVLEQIITFPDGDDAVIVRVAQSSAPGYGDACPEGTELLMERERWNAFVRLQSERNLAASREACRKRVLRRLIRQVRDIQRPSVPPEEEWRGETSEPTE